MEHIEEFYSNVLLCTLLYNSYVEKYTEIFSGYEPK